jgi:hypothetical protein
VWVCADVPATPGSPGTRGLGTCGGSGPVTPRTRGGTRPRKRTRSSTRPHARPWPAGIGLPEQPGASSQPPADQATDRRPPDRRREPLGGRGAGHPVRARDRWRWSKTGGRRRAGRNGVTFCSSSLVWFRSLRDGSAHLGAEGRVRPGAAFSVSLGSQGVKSWTHVARSLRRADLGRNRGERCHGSFLRRARCLLPATTHSAGAIRTPTAVRCWPRDGCRPIHRGSRGTGTAGPLRGGGVDGPCRQERGAGYRVGRRARYGAGTSYPVDVAGRPLVVIVGPGHPFARAGLSTPVSHAGRRRRR